MTLRSIRHPAVLVVALLGACGGDDGIGHTFPFPTFEKIAGSYTGALAGTTQGIALAATISLTITQDESYLSGSYAITGTLNDGVSVVAVQETGSFTGAIETGNNPSVAITLVNQCPNYSARFSGWLDSLHNQLTFSGPVDILLDDCTIFLTYQFAMLLRR